MNLGQKVHQIRKQRQLSIRAAANQSDMSIAYLSKIENNEANPTIDALERLAYTFKVNVNELMPGTIQSISSLTLTNFISLYKETFPELEQQEWQKILNGITIRGRYPKSNDDWLMIFLAIRKSLL